MFIIFKFDQGCELIIIIIQQNIIVNMKQSSQKKLDSLQYKQKYDNYFKNVKQNIQHDPAKKDLQNHRIKILDNKLLNMRKLSNMQSQISTQLIQKQGAIVTYNVVISKFNLEIILLNFEQDTNSNKRNKDLLLGSGAFGQVRIQSSTNKTFAVKRLQFKLKNHFDKQLDMKANKIQIEEAIKQFSIYKICSLYKIGPSINTDIGFDLICYNNCIEFHMQICQKFTQSEIMREIKSNHHKFKRFKKEIKTAVYLLHSFHIIHKDIKPNNILYSITYGKFVLSDFGISHPIMEDIGYRSQTYKEGTYAYMSMEMFKLKQGEKGYVNLYQNDVHALKLIKPLTEEDNFNEIIIKKKIQQNTRKGEFQMSLQVSANESIIEQQQQQIDQIKNKQQQQKQQSLKKPQQIQQQQEQVLSSEHSDCQQSSYQFVNKTPDFKVKKQTYMYQYLKLKYLALKIWTPQDKIGYHVRQYLNKFMDFHIIDILSIIDNCMEYQKIKEVYYSLDLNDLQLKNNSIKAILISLKHQVDSIKNIKIVNNYQNNVSLSKLKNYTRIKGHSDNSLKIIQEMENKNDFNEFRIKIQIIVERQKSIQNCYKCNSNRFRDQFRQIIRYLKIYNQKKILYDCYLILFTIQSEWEKMKIYKCLQQLDYQRTKEEELVQYIKLYRFIKQDHNIKKQKFFEFKRYYEELDIKRKIGLQLQYQIAQIYHLQAIVQESEIQRLNRQIDIIKNIYGQLNPILIQYCHILGNLLSKIQKYNQAIQMYNKCLISIKQMYGQYHIIMVLYYISIGHVYKKLRSFEKAIDCYLKSIKIINGEQSYDLLAISYGCLGDTYIEYTDYQKALQNYQKAFDIITNHTQQKQEVAIYCKNIGYIYYLKKNYSQAVAFLKKSLQINIKIYGQNPLNVAQNYYLIGNAFIELRQLQISLDNYQKCLRIRKMYYRQQAPQLLQIYICIGNNYFLQTKYNLALSFYQKSLNIEISIHGENSINIIKYYRKLKNLFTKIEKYQLVADYSLKILQIIIFNKIQNDINLPQFYDNIADIYFLTRDMKKSFEYYLKALLIRSNEMLVQDIYNNNYIQLKDLNQTIIYNKLAEKSLESEKYNQAIQCCSRSLKISKSLNQQICSTSITNSFEIMAIAHSKMKEYKKSIKYQLLLFQTYFKQHKQKSTSLFIKIAINYYNIHKLIETYFYFQFSLQNSINKNEDLETIKKLKKIPKITRYENESKFINNIQKKYKRLKVDKLLTKLRIQKRKLYLKQIYRDNKENKSRLYCLIQIIMCYKYLKYTQQMQKSIYQLRQSVISMQNSLVKSIFQDFLKQI